MVFTAFAIMGGIIIILFGRIQILERQVGESIQQLLKLTNVVQQLNSRTYQRKGENDVDSKI